MLASALTRSISILLVSSFISIAGSVRIDPLPVSGNPSEQNYLQYDDGTAQWLTWAGVYRGVWFNTEDFIGFEWDPELIFDRLTSLIRPRLLHCITHLHSLTILPD